MKILLDENIDVRFKLSFEGGGHDVFTVRDMGWSGVKNGELLKLMEQNGFDVFIAVDKNIPFQQNLSNLPVAVIIPDVRRNTLSHLQPFIPLILKHLSAPLSKEVVVLTV